MKRNVRLARGIQTATGLVDAYVVTWTQADDSFRCHGWVTSNGDDVLFWLSRREFENLPVLTLEVNAAPVPYACERGHRTSEPWGTAPGRCTEDIGGWCGDDEYVACDKLLMQVY